MDTETRKQQELESKLKTKGHELEESQKRLEKLEDHIRVSKIQLDEQEKMASGTNTLIHLYSVLKINLCIKRTSFCNHFCLFQICRATLAAAKSASQNFSVN